MNTTTSTPTHPQPAAAVKAAHTPRWIVEHDTCVDADGNDIWRIIEPNANETGGHLIATVNTGWGDHETNSKLLASAPTLHAENAELVGALQDLADGFTTLLKINRIRPENNETLMFARSLLARSAELNAKPGAQLNQSLHAQPNGREGGRE